MLELQVEKREKTKNLQTLRKQGVLPAVFYGKKQISTPISIYQKQFVKIWKQAGESTVVTLKMGEGESYDSLIQDVDFDPVTGTPRHADFYVFDKDHKIEVAVPVEFVGVSSAVKDFGGLLVKVLHELKIEAVPKDLPREIKVDLSVLKEIGGNIKAKDIILPQGVTLMENLEEVIVLVSEPKEEEPEIEATPDISSIEVEKKGKEKIEGEGVDADTPSEQTKE
ncbi:MAG: 50S ribosomal protein L25 [Candidatus Zambryskibacteria bacterium CG_4_9_14_3_um_filter_40_16]|uniref:Large ribosomal subunit protein bL25 n=2 Tax=Candidatus Zambryskiibacteriota TaxID=1817925 RepID=A0A2H0K761_9BACT|nr:MAG: 50S ribosomal protein L25 [Candidatus Zambryskibacteria bacterium CG11_big_fil_rev_8_21_14_0_20_40_24]PJA33413.1 MAG: 50S ribosomal protein L25 [Candidatus Zambryskibacteria bacterium CG_4_9_14_3_um_filter_40_16]